MKKILSLFFFTIFISYNGFAIDIVPLPYKVVTTKNRFALQKGVDYEKLLQEGDNPIASFEIGLRNQDKKFDELCNSLRFFSEDFGDEGYELLINKGKVVLAANTKQGLFYGKQSLIQLIRSAENNQLQGVHIIDKPALKYRGVMDDISRGPVPTKEYMKYQVRRIAELKLNMLCYYTEHVVKTKKHPEFAPATGSLSIDEWKELSDYAKEYYVELVPNFQSLGHAEKVLLNPKFQHLGESPTMYAPTNPATVEFMKDIYGEMSPAFDSKFFHVNCDETFDLGRGQSAQQVKELGAGTVYANYMNQLSDILKSNGKRMMMWGDIVLKYPDILDKLPQDAIMMTWEYSDYPSYEKWIDPFVKNGFDFMICTGVLNSLRLFPDYAQALPNIRKFIKEGVEKGTMGVLNTVWDEGGLHSFDGDWYGVAYGADQSWNPNNQSIEAFDTRLARGVYGSSGGELFKAIHKLTEMGEIQAIDNMSKIIFWKEIIPERGKYNRYSLADWEEVYEACLEVDSILQNKTAKYYTREYKAVEIVSDEYKYLSKAKLKLAEASLLYAQACRIQFENRAEASRLLEKVKLNVVECRNDLAKLQNNFDAIWKSENRDYWNNFEMDPFNRVLADYDDLIASFDKSMGYFNQGLPLSAPADIRLDIRELQGSYFTYWLVSPAFNLEGGTNFDTDFLKGMKGEKTASPFPGFSFFNDKGENIKWMKYSSSLSDRVSLDKALESKNEAVAYAYCTLESAEEQTVVANFGSAGAMRVFCNGEEVFSKKGSGSLMVDEFECDLNLKPGKNRILLKFEKPANNDWDFSFRIKDKKISSSKNKYRVQQ